MEITLDEIAEIVSLARGKADELEAAVTIVVFNAYGNLKCVERVDGGDPQAILAAIASAQEVRSTTRLNMAWGVQEMDLLTGCDALVTDKQEMLFLSQGLPIFRDGMAIGYIGVAGASVPENLVIAIAGASLYSRFEYREN